MDLDCKSDSGPVPAMGEGEIQLLMKTEQGLPCGDNSVAERYPDTLGQSMTTRADFDKLHDKNLPGIIHGFDFPFNCEQMLCAESYGAVWLTKALRASTAITDDVSVSKIVSCVDISKAVGGGAADKAIMEVEYSGATQCPTKFFLKLPCKKVADRLQAATLNAGGAFQAHPAASV